MGAIALDFEAMTAMRRQRTVPHGSGWTGTTKRIWLLLCAEGGFWSAVEIRAKLTITGPINSPLRDMVEYGSIVQRRIRTVDGETVKYGVIAKCRVPRGVAWEELEDLMQRLTVGGKAPSDAGPTRDRA